MLAKPATVESSIQNAPGETEKQLPWRASKIISSLWQLDLQYFRSFRLQFATQIFSLAFALATYFYLGESVRAQLGGYGSYYFSFVVIGLAGSNLLLAMSHGLPQRLDMDLRSGFFRYLLTLPGSNAIKIVGTAAWLTTFALINAIIYLAVAIVFSVFVTNSVLSLTTFAAITFAIAFGIFGFLGTTLISTAMVLWRQRLTSATWLVSSLQVFCAGVFFPVQILPSWLQAVAQAFPLTHAIEVWRQAILLNQVALESCGWLTLTSVVWLVIGASALRHVLATIQRQHSFIAG